MKIRIWSFLLVLLRLSLTGLAQAQEVEKRMSCIVAKLATPPTIDSKWEKFPWQSIEPLAIDQSASEKPERCPKAQVKIAYDDAAVYVIFRVQDRYVRAVAAEHDGTVWRDSCVEFFFTPGPNVNRGYFNLEMNCGGTMLLHFQKTPRKDSAHLSASECADIQIAHSLPKIVDPEIDKPVVWTVEYRLPLAILDRYCGVDKPASGVVWRANFYKCGDQTSHPHWLAWSPIDIQPVDFHRPQDFGILTFQ